MLFTLTKPALWRFELEKVVFLPIHSDLVEHVAEITLKTAANRSDLSEINVVFPGKRPGYFLRRTLYRKLRDAFYPPEIFEIDAFVQTLTIKNYGLGKPIDPLNAAWIIYETVKEFVEISPFEEFYPWAINLYRLFNELDQELLDDEKLMRIKDYVELDEDIVPAQVIQIWDHIAEIKNAYNSRLIDANLYSPGLLYRLTAEDDRALPDKFTIFGGFFALTASQLKIISRILESDRGVIIFQGNPDDWPILRGLKERLRFPSKIFTEEPTKPLTKIYAGFDLHSETAKVRDILNEIIPEISDEPGELAIIVPKTESLIPLIYQSIGHFDKAFNIAMGYPLKRTPLISLYESVFRAQDNRTDVYTRKDVLKVLTHPFVKNLKANTDTTPFRIAIHTFEEFVNENEVVIIDLHDKELLEKIFYSIERVIKDVSIYQEVIEKFKNVLKLFFYNFEQIETFNDLKNALKISADFLLEHGTLSNYTLNLEFMKKFLEIVEKIEEFYFADEKFEKHNIFNIILYRLKEARVAFEGTPVRGIQVLGSLEARAINFKNIVYLDLNEGVIPGEPELNPILPPSLRVSLGLPDYRKTEEIYRYHFKRLYYASDNAFLLYIDNKKTSRSRYIEEIIWEEEKKAGRLLEDELVEKRFFRLNLKKSEPKIVEKTPEIMETLKNMTFSPTSIDTYLRCPLKFYYSYVLKLKKQEVSDEIEKLEIGRIAHKILYRFYKQVEGREADYEKVLTEKNLLSIIEDEFRRDFPEKWGIAILVRRATEKLLTNFLWRERHELDGKKRIILALEYNLMGKYNTGKNVVRFTGRADRIEKIGDETFITDYKSTSSGKTPFKKRKEKEIEGVLNREKVKGITESFQLPIYLELYMNHFGIKDYSKINARLISLNPAKNPEIKLFPEVQNKRDHIMSRLKEALNAIIDEIFDPDVPFSMDDSSSFYCGYCPFKEFCGVEYGVKR